MYRNRAIQQLRVRLRVDEQNLRERRREGANGSGAGGESGALNQVMIEESGEGKFRKVRERNFGGVTLAALTFLNPREIPFHSTPTSFLLPHTLLPHFSSPYSDPLSQSSSLHRRRTSPLILHPTHHPLLSSPHLHLPSPSHTTIAPTVVVVSPLLSIHHHLHSQIRSTASDSDCEGTTTDSATDLVASTSVAFLLFLHLFVNVLRLWIC
ncbi:hypothetical protein Drorol1_Dr00022162 [Drosera rotundifolia]